MAVYDCLLIALQRFLVVSSLEELVAGRFEVCRLVYPDKFWSCVGFLNYRLDCYADYLAIAIGSCDVAV